MGRGRRQEMMDCGQGRSEEGEEVGWGRDIVCQARGPLLGLFSIETLGEGRHRSDTGCWWLSTSRSAPNVQGTSSSFLSSFDSPLSTTDKSCSPSSFSRLSRLPRQRLSLSKPSSVSTTSPSNLCLLLLRSTSRSRTSLTL
jgi:hypothetical protein